MRFTYVLLFGFNLIMEIKMTDSEHLCWIIGRLINVHGENPNIDYMVKLQNIAQKLDRPVGKINPKADEWPKVGDEVLIDLSEYNPVYGQGVDGLTCVVRSIFKDKDVDVYAVSRDGACYCFVRGILKKPKTEAEILRDEIETFINDLIDFDYSSASNAEYIRDALFDSYNITKKQ